MKEPTPVWVEEAAIIALHDRTLSLHGGPSGIRDGALLSSAMQRPKDRFQYAGTSSLFDLAATYAVSIATNHPFVDGNKRAAFQAMILFLALNGVPLKADPVEATLTMLSVASGDIDIAALSEWIAAKTT